MNNLPEDVLKYFWGDRLADLSWDKHKDYITKTILEKGDTKAIRWLFTKTDKDYVLGLANAKKLDQKSKNLWNIYLS